MRRPMETLEALACSRSPWIRKAALGVYGDESLAKRVAAGQKRWIALGRPKITDHKVELADPTPATDEPDTWLDKRPHATLKLSLGVERGV